MSARYIGCFDPVPEEAADRQVAQACNAGGYRKVLIDFRDMEGLPSKAESYRSAGTLADRGFNIYVKFALVDRLEYAEANKFYETVAKNRGFNLRHFYDLDEALAWLREE